MAYSFLQQCIRDGSLLRWFDLRRWHKNYLDLSGLGYDLTTTSNLWWGGGGVQFANANGYASGDSTGLLALTTQTIVFMGTFGRIERAAASPAYVMALEDGVGGAGWRLGLDDTPRIIFEDNTPTTRTLAFNYRGHRTIGVTMSNGGTPVGYSDGASLGNFSGVVAIGAAPPSNDLYVGNRQGADRSMRNPLHATLIFNDVKSAADMLAIHEELMSLPGGDH